MTIPPSRREDDDNARSSASWIEAVLDNAPSAVQEIGFMLRDIASPPAAADPDPPVEPVVISPETARPS